MKRVLALADKLQLPLDLVTSTLLVLGGKGMGKTNLGSVIAEELSAAGLHFGIIDPLGVWHGLCHSADGRGLGIPVLILGGIHGSMPIEPTGGAVVADLLADEEVDVVIDISRRSDGQMWSLGERIRFVTDFCSRIYQRQGERRRPLHLLIDEAGRYVPQQIPAGAPELARCVGAIERLVEEGRNVGVGVTLITQRSARINKSVAELADCMVAFRTVGPRSIDAVMDWFGEHVQKERIKVLVERLRELPRGTALVVSPGWLKFEGEVPIRLRTTFDSSATPEPGKVDRRASGKGAAVDAARFLTRMAETVERAKADDPKALRAEIARLKGQLAKAPAAAPAPAPKTVEVPVVPEGAILALDKATAKLGDVLEAVRTVAVSVDSMRGELRRRAVAGAPVAPTAPPPRTPRPLPHQKTDPNGVNVARPVARASSPAAPDESVTPPRQRLLDALAWLEVIGIAMAPKPQVAFLANSSASSSTLDNNLGALRSAGLIDYPTGGFVCLTPAGRARAVAPAAPPTTAELQAAVKSKLPPMQGAILDVLVATYPGDLAKGELAEKANVSAASSTFDNNLGALRSLGVIEYPSRGRVRAKALLFLEAR